jgi:hypothetical protein
LFAAGAVDTISAVAIRDFVPAAAVKLKPD